MSRNQIQVKFGIVPKLLLGILVPLIASMILMGVFLGLQGSNIVNEVMNEQLNAQADSAANEETPFLRNITAFLSAWRPLRLSGIRPMKWWRVASLPTPCILACWRRYV